MEQILKQTRAILVQTTPSSIQSRETSTPTSVTMVQLTRTLTWLSGTPQRTPIHVRVWVLCRRNARQWKMVWMCKFDFVHLGLKRSVSLIGNLPGCGILSPRGVLLRWERSSALSGLSTEITMWPFQGTRLTRWLHGFRLLGSFSFLKFRILRSWRIQSSSTSPWSTS